MEKLNFFGIGPEIGRITLPYLVITIAAAILFPSKLTFGKSLQGPFMIAGIVLIVMALIFILPPSVLCSPVSGITN